MKGEGERKLRILVAKPGLDGHDRGAKIIARALRDAGFEVIYTGLHQTPEMIVSAALQEDVDVVSLSILSGAHNYLFPEIIRQLKEKGLGDVTVMGGGTIPDEDVLILKKQGVAAIFTPGTDTRDVVDWIKKNVKPRKI
ncbi:MAG: cobalamin B12-binding domain-containing protein [Deltaproteobacteria bacterium]|nr:cobalamin B12-binding domain-containing protein [Deltaproteobacteria bacterium]MBI2500384.1 cobalamin B12-binding domain-containing protein [Deltaproteobacteria bacterium]MBI4196317.1 cobalamin B12-binding domain-containing protein [Deltaproteobacteria bacterium]